MSIWDMGTTTSTNGIQFPTTYPFGAQQASVNAQQGQVYALHGQYSGGLTFTTATHTTPQAPPSPEDEVAWLRRRVREICWR